MAALTADHVHLIQREAKTQKEGEECERGFYLAMPKQVYYLHVQAIRGGRP